MYGYQNYPFLSYEDPHAQTRMWAAENERPHAAEEKIVFITPKEANDTEPPGSKTDLYSFIVQLAKDHNFWTPKWREWCPRARFYALLFNAGRISGIRETRSKRKYKYCPPA